MMCGMNQAWINVERAYVKGDVCYECYMDILKRDKLENGKVKDEKIERT